MMRLSGARLMLMTIFLISTHAADTCSRDTGGTCAWFGCDKARGETICTKISRWNYKCMCKPGSCAIENGEGYTKCIPYDPVCYKQGKCKAGYMDSTNGGSKHWSCAERCEGGPYMSTNVCNCACQKATGCTPEGTPVAPDQCRTGHDDRPGANSEAKCRAMKGCCYSASDDGCASCGKDCRVGHDSRPGKTSKDKCLSRPGCRFIYDHCFPPESMLQSSPVDGQAVAAKETNWAGILAVIILSVIVLSYIVGKLLPVNERKAEYAAIDTQADAEHGVDEERLLEQRALSN